jgi:hypothetical protein
MYNAGFNKDVAKMNRTYRTPKGTELPILSLRGKDYLEVKFRLVWFREEHPDWSIETEILSATENSAYARATIKDEQGRIIATSHKFETKQGFPDFIEKAETGSIGRALALIGYGTQFCADELDEGDRIVDAPIQQQARNQQRSQARNLAPVSAPAAAQPAAVTAAPRAPSEATDENQEQSLRQGRLDAGDYRISFGKKYKGHRLRDIPRKDLEGYVEWLAASAERKGVPLSDEARFLKMAVTRYLAETEKQNH